MKLGLALWPERDVRELAELAVAAEEAGFDELWWPDHYYAREFSAVLAACALRTGRIKLGTAVTSPLLRHPAILASLFATIDELSDGRALAGLGPGGFEVKTELQVSAPSPLGAIRESVLALRGLLAGERVSLPEARRFPLANATLGFRPKSEIPIYLAARGPKMLELSGGIADGAITHGLARPYLDLVREQVQAGAGLAGRPAGACEIALMLEVVIDDDLARAYDALRPRCLYMVGGEYAEELVPKYELDPARVSPIRAAVRARDPGAVGMIDDQMVDAFSVGGPAGRVAERLAELAGRGIDSMILTPGQGADAAMILNLGKVARRAVG